MQWSGLRALFGAIDDSMFAVAGRAFQIVDWDRTHQFCGRCGTPTQVKNSERARECPNCKQVHYPRIAPAILALVRRGRELLLARSPHFAPGMYSALAGFVEPGETLEQTLVREVREEVGIEVANVRYFASQPWPVPAFPDDRLQRRLRRRGNHAGTRRNRGGGLVHAGPAAGRRCPARSAFHAA